MLSSSLKALENLYQKEIDNIELDLKITKNNVNIVKKKKIKQES